MTESDLRQLVESLTPSKLSYLSMLLATASTGSSSSKDEAASYFHAVASAGKSLGLSLPRAVGGLQPALRTPAAASLVALQEYIDGLVVHSPNCSRAQRIALVGRIVGLVPDFLDAKKIALTPRTFFNTLKTPGALMHHHFPGYPPSLIASSL